MKTHLGLNFLLIFLLGFSPLFHLTISETDPSDASVMFSLKKSLSPPTGLGWSDPDPCSWNHVVCSKNKRVVRIQIGHQDLKGTLPPTLSNLTQLERLELQWNKFSGPLPSLNGLASLQVLMLSNNQFTSIPDDFFNGMSSLQSIEIDNNPFECWVIPDSLTDASTLQNFSANSANLTGPLPGFLDPDSFPGLVNLHLALNNLQGPLPGSFSGSQLESFWVNGNMTFLINLKSIKVVNLTNNLLQGPVPSFNSSVSVDMVKGSNSFCLPEPGDCDPRVNTLLSIA